MSVTVSDPHLDTDAPGEVVTLFFSDIEGSTRLLESIGDSYPDVILQSRRILTDVTARHSGVGTDSGGDAFFAVFRRASDALRAAVDVQRAFFTEAWAGGATVRVRIGLHTGQPRSVDGAYFGLDVHRAARIASAAAGGQILLSADTRAQLRDSDLPVGLRLHDIGAYRLKDIRFPEILFEVSLPDLPAPVGSTLPVETRPHNLPLSSTLFVGREALVHEVRTLLLRDDVRLLTLTGAGGTGKTRLALQVAEGLIPAFAHGVFFVPLAPVSDPGLIASTVVQVLGLPEFSTRTPLDILKHHLAPRQLLLILDNFEQLLEGSLVLLDLLRESPGLKILATSREALNLRLEREYVVAPLELPRAGGAADVAALAGVESVRLLLDRIRRFDRAFELTSANAPAIRDICLRLDGLPLALELAASQLRLHTPQALLADLEGGQEVLTGGPRDLADHQRTLDDTIGWSHRLLTRDEQQLFRRLAVFRGGCTIESAAAVVSDLSRIEILRGLHSLTAKSLLTHDTVAGESRIGMLETIREFATRRLRDRQEDDELRQRHARHYLELAEALAPGLVTREQRGCITRLQAEEDNLRAALSWAISQGDAVVTSRLMSALLWMWISRGQFDEARAWARRALEHFDVDGRRGEHALILECAGWIHALSGDYPAALPHFERSHAIFHEWPGEVDRLRSKVTLGVTCLVLGDPRGTALSDEAVAGCRQVDAPQVTALALLSVGIKHQLAGDDLAAAAAYETALQAFTAVGNVFWSGQLLLNLAHLRLHAGNARDAAVLAVRAIEIGREYDYATIRNQALAVAGAVLLQTGRPAAATRFFGAVQAALDRLGVTFEPPEQEAMLHALTALRSQLDERSFAAAMQEGRGWDERALTAALGDFIAGLDLPAFGQQAPA